MTRRARPFLALGSAAAIPFAALACEHGADAIAPRSPVPSATLAASASASAPPVVASTAPSASASAPAPPCFSDTLKSAPIADFGRIDDALVVCYASENGSDRECLAEDPKTRGWSRVSYVAPVPPPPPPPPFSIKTDGNKVKVCSFKGDCKTVTPGFGPGRSADFEGAVNDSGSRLFLYHYVAGSQSGVVAQHKLTGELFDVATGKHTKSIPMPVGTASKPGPFADQSDTWRAEWLGERLMVSAYRCCGPAGIQLFLDPKTGKLQTIGDPALFLKLDADTYLVGREGRWFDEKAGTTSGKVTLNVLDLKGAKETELAMPSAPRDAPETHVLEPILQSDGTIEIAYANPPGIVTFDPKTKSLGKPRGAPICAPLNNHNP
jgi:hypothetical protein